MAEMQGGQPFRIRMTHQLVLIIALVALIVVVGIVEPVFFRPEVLFDVTAIVGELGIMALVQTYIITTGGIDLSVGYNLQMCAIVFGLALAQTHSVLLAIIAAIVVGTLGGVLNGLIISRTKIPALVTTLATMYLFRGLSMIAAGTNTYSGFPEGFKKISSIELFGFIPIQFTYLLVLFVLFSLFYNRGAFGRVLKGIGFNENAVLFSGINSKRALFVIYTLAGTVSGLASIIYLGRLSSATTSMGDGINLQVVTAVVLGGTSVFGGVGSVTGTFVATLLIGVLRKGFTLLNLSGNFFNFSLGLILIASLIALSLVEKRKAGRVTPLQKPGPLPSGQRTGAS